MAKVLARVFLHKDPDGKLIYEERQFARLPCVGEYVALNASRPWYRVYAVVHCPKTNYEAEIYLSDAVRQTKVIAARKPLTQKRTTFFQKMIVKRTFVFTKPSTGWRSANSGPEFRTPK